LIHSVDDRSAPHDEGMKEVFVSVQLTVRVEQSEYLIRCPDGAHHHVEDGTNYVVMPSPFEVDEPDERLWLSDALLIEKARAGAWGFFLISETVPREETAGRAQHRAPLAVRTGHKQSDRRSSKSAATAPGARRARVT
jgi:hypothetical protein